MFKLFLCCSRLSWQWVVLYDWNKAIATCLCKWCQACLILWHNTTLLHNSDQSIDMTCLCIHLHQCWFNFWEATIDSTYWKMHHEQSICVCVAHTPEMKQSCTCICLTLNKKHCTYAEQAEDHMRGSWKSGINGLGNNGINKDWVCSRDWLQQ